METILLFLTILILTNYIWYHIWQIDKKRFNEILRVIDNLVNGCEENHLVSSIKKILKENFKRR